MFPKPTLPTTRPRGSRPSLRVLSTHCPARTMRSFRTRLWDNASTKSTIDSAIGRTTPSGVSTPRYRARCTQPNRRCRSPRRNARSHTICLRPREPAVTRGFSEIRTSYPASCAGTYSARYSETNSCSRPGSFSSKPNPISGKMSRFCSSRKSAEMPTRNRASFVIDSCLLQHQYPVLKDRRGSRLPSP